MVLHGLKTYLTIYLIKNDMQRHHFRGIPTSDFTGLVTDPDFQIWVNILAYLFFIQDSKVQTCAFKKQIPHSHFEILF